jgi:hypothetical protein
MVGRVEEWKRKGALAIGSRLRHDLATANE